MRTMKAQIIANIELEGLGIDNARLNTFRGTKELSFRNKHVHDQLLMNIDSHMHGIIIEQTYEIICVNDISSFIIKTL